MILVAVLLALIGSAHAWTSQSVQHNKPILAASPRVRIVRDGEACTLYHDNKNTRFQGCSAAAIEYPWIFLGYPNDARVRVAKHENQHIKMKQILEGSNRFGFALDVSESWLVVGAPGNISYNEANKDAQSPKCSPDNTPEPDTAPGAIHLFELQRNVWESRQTIERPEKFGWALAIDGDTAVVGAPGDIYANMECYGQATGSFTQGNAYLLLKKDEWEVTQTFEGESGDAVGMLEYRALGRAVAVQGGLVAISSYPLYNRPNLPVVYTYDCSGTSCVDQKHFLAPASVLNAITDTFASTQIGDPDRIAPSWQNELWGASIIVSDSYIFASDPALSGIWQLSIKYNAERKHPSSHQSMVEIERKILSNDLSIQGCEEGYVGNNACTKCPAVYYSHSIWNEQCIRCPPSLLSPAGSYRSSACTSQGALEGTGVPPEHYTVAFILLGVSCALLVAACVWIQIRMTSSSPYRKTRR